MKLITLILLILLATLQYRLWLGHGNLIEVGQLQQTLAEKKEENKSLKEQTQSLAAEVLDLKHGLEAIEERARSEMGMIKKGETFYQIVPSAELPPAPVANK